MAILQHTNSKTTIPPPSPTLVGENSFVMLSKPYNSLLEALNAYRAMGYTEDFNLKPNALACQADNVTLFPAEFHIDFYSRFDGQTDPDEESILYAISSEKYQLKGVLVNGYGPSADELTAELANKLRI